MLNHFPERSQKICQLCEQKFDSFSLYLSRLMAKAPGWGIMAAANIFLITGGVLLLVFASEASALAGAKSWDAPIYYHDQLLFAGRLLLYLAGSADLCFYFFKKKVPLVKNLLYCGLFLGVILQTDSYCRRGFWNDTIELALHLKSFSWKELLLPGHPNPYLQMAPPALIVFSKLSGSCFGFNKWVLTLPALLFSIGALFAFKDLARKLLTPWGVTAAVWLFALNPGVWIYAGEFKQYCCDIFFTILILSAMTDHIQDEAAHWKKLCLWGVISLLFSHAMFFVLPAAGLALLLRYLKGARHYSFFVIAGVWFIAGLAAVCYTTLMMPKGMYTHEHHLLGFAPVPDSLENLKWYWTSLTSLFFAPWGMAWKFSLLLLFPCIGMFFGIRKLASKHGFFLLICAVILLLLYIASALHQYSLASGVPFAKGRLILFTIPPAILIFCGSLTQKRALIWVAPVMLSLLLHCGTAMMPFGKSDQAVKELLRRYTPGDQLVVCSKISRRAMLLYAPENFIGKVRFIEIGQIEKLSPDSGYIHIFFDDFPAGKVVPPQGYVVKRADSFAFSSVITLQRKADTPR